MPLPANLRKRPALSLSREVEYVDYKDVDLLSRFMSDRGKIRGQRINGNDVQHGAGGKTPSRLREMGLLPYARRVASLPAVVHARDVGRPRNDDNAVENNETEIDETENDEVTDDQVEDQVEATTNDTTDDGEEA